MRTLTAEQGRAYELVRKYGKQSTSYNIIQDDMEYVFGRDSVTGVRRLRHPVMTGGREFTYTLGEPVCADEGIEEAIDAVLEENRRTVFLNIEDRAAEVLAKKGCLINRAGTESWLEVQKYNLKGGKKLKLRTAYNKGQRQRLVVEEKKFEEVDKGEVLRIAEEWLEGKAKNDRELDFLIHPAYFEDEPDSRKFFIYKNDTLLGYIFFIPMFSGGKVFGYNANLLRCRKDSPRAVLEYGILKSLEKFREEGIERLHLGYAPLHEIRGREPYRHSRVIKKLLVVLYKKGNKIYHFRQLAKHKMKYAPKRKPVYVAFPPGRRLPLRELVGAFRVSGLI